MSVQNLTTRPVTRLRATEKPNIYDPDNPTLDWADPDTQEIRVWLEQSSGSENQDSQDTNIGEWFMVAGPDADIKGSDRIQFGETTLEVIGPPFPVWTPSGGLHHVEAKLRRFT